MFNHQLPEKLDAVIHDLVAALVYYDRKEDDDLPRGEIERMIRNGEASVDGIVDVFRQYLAEALATTTGW